MAAGKKTGGRTKGTPNKTKANFDSALEELGLEPEHLLAAYAQDRVPCGRCDDEHTLPPTVALLIRGPEFVSDKALRVASMAQQEGVRVTCPRCAGTGFRILGDGEALRALIRIIDSRAPKLSAITLDGRVDTRPVLSILGNIEDPAEQAVMAAVIGALQAKEHA